AHFLFGAAVPDSAELVDLARYFLVGIAVASVCEAMRREADRARAEHALREASVEARLDSERALRKGEQRFRMLIGQVRDYAIFLLDGDGRVTSWNEGVERVLGFREEEFLGLELGSVIYTPQDRALGVPERELETARARGVTGYDRWLRRKDGTAFFAS